MRDPFLTGTANGSTLSVLGFDRAAVQREPVDLVADARLAVEPVLRAAVARLPASIRTVAEYHFGWRDEHGNAVSAASGKSVRPTLVLLAAQSVGGTSSAAGPAAVAVELVHNFSLLHDDVMDGDQIRRHRPCAWRVFGTKPAILAGDALLALALDVLAAHDHPATVRGIRILGAAVQSLLDGQGADLTFEQRHDVTVAECVAMIEGKTAALFEAACALGGVFGDADPHQLRHLRTFGHEFGMSFQIVDDLLGIWGDPLVTGKPVHSDLRSRKKSAPVVAALTSSAPAAGELAALYHRDAPLSDADLGHAAALVEAAGGRAWSQRQADAFLATAVDHLSAAELKPRAGAELAALARSVVGRDH